MDYWHKAGAVTLLARCVRLLLLASSSRVHHNGASRHIYTGWRLCIKLWLMLKNKNKKTHMFMVLDDSTSMIMIANNHSYCINQPHNLLMTFLVLSDPSQTAMLVGPTLARHQYCCSDDGPMLGQLALLSGKDWRELPTMPKPPTPTPTTLSVKTSLSLLKNV